MDFRKVSIQVDIPSLDQIVSHASRYPSRHIQLDPAGEQPKSVILWTFFTPITV